jgi:polyhydroxyalkanoate synthesis regulator phasin
MAGFSELVQKAFYIGVGVASYAAERAGTTLGELRGQAQKLADEMVARGEMTAEEARRMVDEMVARAQQQPGTPPPTSQPSEPRRIEILEEDELVADPEAQAVENMREQIAKLQEELRRLKREG